MLETSGTSERSLDYRMVGKVYDTTGGSDSNGIGQKLMGRWSVSRACGTEYKEVAFLPPYFFSTTTHYRNILPSVRKSHLQSNIPLWIRLPCKMTNSSQSSKVPSASESLEQSKQTSKSWTKNETSPKLSATTSSEAKRESMSFTMWRWLTQCQAAQNQLERVSMARGPREVERLNEK